MKKKKRVVTLLSVLMAVTVSTVPVSATALNDDTPKYPAKASAQKLLTKGQVQSFTAFVQQNKDKLGRYPEVQNVMRVVEVFNTAPAQFLKMTPDQQRQFQLDVARLEGRLASLRGAEASAWRQVVSQTAHTMNYLWKYAGAEVLVEPTEVQN
jgi:hypothetical protein